MVCRYSAGDRQAARLGAGDDIKGCGAGDLSEVVACAREFHEAHVTFDGHGFGSHWNAADTHAGRKRAFVHVADG
jgi:hypothetical protein